MLAFRNRWSLISVVHFVNFVVFEVVMGGAQCWIRFGCEWSIVWCVHSFGFQWCLSLTVNHFNYKTVYILLWLIMYWSRIAIPVTLFKGHHLAQWHIHILIARFIRGGTHRSVFAISGVVWRLSSNWYQTICKTVGLDHWRIRFLGHNFVFLGQN